MPYDLPKAKGKVSRETLEEFHISRDSVIDHEEAAKAFLAENIAKAKEADEEEIDLSSTYVLTDEEMWDLSGKILKYCEVQSGIAMYYYQRDFARRIIFSVIVEDTAMITSLWARQCLASDTIVLSRNGSACQIKDHPDAWITGHEPVFKVRAKNGFYVRATANHPFLTKRGWIRTDELDADDWLCVLDGWNCFGDGAIKYKHSQYVNMHRTDTTRVEFQLDEDYGKILGYLTADGYSFRALECGQSIKFTSITPAYLNEFEKLICEKFPDVKTTRYVKGNGFDIVCTSAKGATFQTNSLRVFLAAMSPDDKFPTEIFNAPQNTIVAFLNRLYAADGCAWTSGDRGAVDLACGGSEVYGQYVVALLARLGISSHVKAEVMNGNDFYRVQIADKDNIAKFLAAVGLIYGKEDACKAICTDYGDRWSNRAVEPAPPGEDGENRAWVRLDGVVPDGHEDVWDMEVPVKRWFTANGITVHNSGKTETVAQVITGMIIILPLLATIYTDPRIQKFADGVWVGIFGPTYELAGIMYNRMRTRIFSKHARAVLSDPDISIDLSTFRGRALQFPNGSFVDVQSAGPGSKIEGKTYHIALLEETQDIPNLKIKKSIAPMLASTAGTKVKIGTPNPDKNDFYDSCETNKDRDERRLADFGEKDFDRYRYHFEYDYTHAAKCNPRYAKYIKSQLDELGYDSDEFRMSYRIQWLVERNRFLTANVLDGAGVLRGYTLKWTDSDTNEEKGEFKVYGLVQNDPIIEDEVIIAADFGKTRSSTVLTAGKVWTDREYYDGQDTRYRVHIIDWLELEGDDHEEQHGQIMEWIGRFPNLFKFIGDATGKGDPILSRIKAELESRGVIVVPFIFSTQSKHDGYTVYYKELASKRFTYPYGKQTRSRRVRRFRQQHLELKKEWKGRHIVVEKQKDDDTARDDYCDSGMMLCYAANVDRSGVMEQLDENPFLFSTRRHAIMGERHSRAAWQAGHQGRPGPWG